MEYYRLSYEENDENYYFEINEEQTVLREVIEDEERWIVSSQRDEELHFCLYDQQFDQDMNQAIREDISAEEFEKVWQEALKPYMKDWEKTMQTFKVGDHVKGIVEVIYPQGIILSLPNDALGVINVGDCVKGIPAESLYPGHLLKAVVAGFDQVNLWIKLEQGTIV